MGPSLSLLSSISTCSFPPSAFAAPNSPIALAATVQLSTDARCFRSIGAVQFPVPHHLLAFPQRMCRANLCETLFPPHALSTGLMAITCVQSTLHHIHHHHHQTNVHA
ncbi:hypothetical protein M438DRAFT_66613 [Aureobasidium pullulans EXF-150]|uniref:Uncharacterized protein n=1 Tax=Aureobasidium pullulans EXF-150 TaxID=1043002 RepID=A0A074X8Y6_AURPU|nr:uncharacterized protein M438DRAFT_66613 [Aureobasidium pullulans EXF-150]KEQ81990.1 hypothetical protein M438DRAFT_66613 [Aureobasidium pullulans EXF-150]